MSDLLGMEPSPDDDDDMKQRKEKVNALLASAWHTYIQLERHGVHSHHDIDTFWRARGSLIYDAVAPYIWFSTTAALVVHSFSLAGLIDSKNTQKMSRAFRATGVAMFCNGDVEERFTMEWMQALAAVNYQTGARPCVCAVECCVCVPRNNFGCSRSPRLGFFFVRKCTNMYEYVQMTFFLKSTNQ